MPITICGKNCETCSWKEYLNCPGCNDGPGHEVTGDCELAKCCRANGLESCLACQFHPVCGHFQKKEQKPEERWQKKAAEQKRENAERARFLAPLLRILFWLIIPIVISGYMTNETLVTLVPAIRLPGQVLSFICTATYAVILLKLAKMSSHYRIAGIGGLAAAVTGVLYEIIPADVNVVLLVIILLVNTVCTVVREYMEYKGHAAVLQPIAADLSGRWDQLRKWYVGTTCASFIGSALILIGTAMGIFILLAGLTGLIVVSIIKLVYLYRTGSVFKRLASDDAADAEQPAA